MREWTPLLIVALPPLLGLLDVALYQLGGNDATFSRVMLTARQRNPLVAVNTAYTLCLMMGHLFTAVGEPAPPRYEVLARCAVALSPTVYALIIIWADNGAVAAHRRVLENGPVGLGAYMTAAGLVGGFVGAAWLPQHDA